MEIIRLLLNFQISADLDLYSSIDANIEVGSINKINTS